MAPKPRLFFLTPKGKQEFVKVARTKNKKKPRTWVIVYKLMTGPEVDASRSRQQSKERGASLSNADWSHQQREAMQGLARSPSLG